MKKVLIWVVAFLLTLVVAYYQRVTGPTYPVDEKIVINGNEVEFKYIRSHSTTSNAQVVIVIPNKQVSGKIYSRLYPTNGEFIASPMIRKGDSLVGEIEKLPPAGKREYYIELYDADGNVIYTRSDEPVVIRFKGDVPAGLLIPHILFMFLAMFFGITAGLLALFDDLSFRKIQVWTLVTLIIGGFILGPLVQKYAFGQLWTGIPFGWDLTDNKTLIMLVGWLAAIWANRHESRRWWTVGAAVLQTVVYLIPHSLFGSTLNPQTGEVTQGLIMFISMFF